MDIENKSTENKKRLLSTKRLMLLVTVVRAQKADYFVDLIESYGANMQFTVVGSGTTKSTIFLNEVGTKTVIFSLVVEDILSRLLKVMAEKFNDIRNSKGVCWAVPLTSVMGVTLFNFLSNNKSSIIG